MFSFLFPSESKSEPAAIPSCEHRRLAEENENELFALAKSRQPASQNFGLKTYDVDAGTNKIHTVEVTGNSSANSEAKAPLVIMHGYGNGVGYLFRNILPIAAQLPGRRVLGIDMLGFGLSSRPAFEFESAPRITAGSEDGNGNVHGAEDFFVNSLEQWRQQQKIEKMVLCGHSMGGYLSVSYAERFPDRVEKLVLLSPVGVPAWNADTDKERYAAANWKFKSLITIARSAWKMGITPMSFIRALPEGRGKKLVDTYVYNRLNALQDDEKRLLSDYFYNISCMPGSGEYCLQHILRPGAYSRVALADRIPKLDVKEVSFIYGQHDWMDVNGGMQVQEKLETLKKEKVACPNCEVRVVMDSGHLLMLENPDGTNSQLAMTVNGKGKEHTIKTGQIYRNEENKLVFSKRPTKVKVEEVSKNQV